MIKIIEGTLFSGAHEYIKGKIGENVTRGVRTYLIVPEQQTLNTESELAEYLPPSAPLHFEVTNFTRFSDTTARAVGGVKLPLCDRTTKRLIMWRALSNISRELTMTGGKEISSGLVDRALLAVMTFESYGTSAGELILAANRLDRDNARLVSKLTDGAKILTEYKRILGENYSDSADELEITRRTIEERGSFLSGAEFFIEGFTSFTEGQYRLISSLSRICSVSVALPLPKHKRDAFEYKEIAKTYRRLQADADEEGVEKKLIRTTDSIPCELIYECVNLLWQTGGKIHEEIEYTDEVSLYECATPYEECDFVASDIRRRILEGASFRDIAIITGNNEAYDGILDLSLSRYDIPYFASRSSAIESFLPIRLIYSALEVILGGWRMEDVIAYAKCTPSLISREECDIFELYVNMWGISGEAFYREGLWNMNPDGYTTRHSSDMGERLISINATRDRIIAPLRTLDERFGYAKCVKDYAEALYGFLLEISLYDMINAHRLELIALEEGERAYEYSKLSRSINSSLDTLVRVAGDSPISRDEFYSLLKVAFSGVSIGTLPLYYDTVSIGSADMIRLHDKKHIYIIGANRGIFPRSAADEGYLSDKDKSILSSLGLPITDERELAGAKEMFIFIRAMAYAEESVTISYSKKSASLGDLTPSDAVKRLIAISDKRISPIAPPKRAEAKIHNERSAIYEFPSLSGLEYEAVRALLYERGQGALLERLSSPIDLLNIDTGGEVITSAHEGPLALTQSRLDDFRACPLLYFLKYDLRLRSEDKAELDTRNVGTFIHAVLEDFFLRVRNENIPIDTIDEGMMRDMIRTASAKFVQSINDGNTELSRRDEVLIERLCRVSLPVVSEMCRELKGSLFVPTYFELKLEDNAEGRPSPARFYDEDGGEVSVYGTIDRVDTYKTDDELYVRVIDYKTGSKEFSPADLKEGKNLQMFLYLKAIVESDDKLFLRELGAHEGKAPLPASVIYIRCSVGKIKADSPSDVEAKLEKVNSRRGMILHDEAVISATGIPYSPARFNKNGSVNASYKDNVYTLEGWGDHMNTIGSFISATAKRIRRGDIRPTPDKKGACLYCHYRDICRIK